MPPILPLALLAATLLELVHPVSAVAHILAANSFEEPSVAGPMAKSAGGDPSLPTGKPPFWECFEDQPCLGCDSGSIVAGLTNRIARTGTQSLFVEAQSLCAPYIGAHWATRPIPVESGKYYKITLWSRSAPGSASKASPARLYLNIRVSFYSDQGVQEMSESLYQVLPLKGSPGNGVNSETWTPLRFGFEAPENAKSLIVSFRCDGRASKEAITGTIYFDDFSLSEEPPSTEERYITGRREGQPGRGNGTNRHSRRLFACR